MKILSNRAVVYLFFAKRKGRTKRNGCDFVAKRGGKSDGDDWVSPRNGWFFFAKRKGRTKRNGYDFVAKGGSESDGVWLGSTKK